MGQIRPLLPQLRSKFYQAAQVAKTYSLGTGKLEPPRWIRPGMHARRRLDWKEFLRRGSAVWKKKKKRTGYIIISTRFCRWSSRRLVAICILIFGMRLANVFDSLCVSSLCIFTVDHHPFSTSAQVACFESNNRPQGIFALKRRGESSTPTSAGLPCRGEIKGKIKGKK